MHDYYRIADVWDGSRRAQQSRVRMPWWRTLPDARGSRWSTRGGGRARVLEPEADPVTWRDEVALDFPSLDAPAARMCQAFLAADDVAPRCRVALDLHRRHTVRARRVPVRVVVATCCACCGGRGEVWGDPCVACDGRGLCDEPRYVVLRVPADVRDGARLRYRLESTHAPALVIDARVRVR